MHVLRICILEQTLVMTVYKYILSREVVNKKKKPVNLMSQ
jgi:hypothetical protein